jgi:predicted dehydrogenase
LHESFADCVRNRKAPLTDPIAGKESVRVGLAGELSVRESRPVKMSEIPA